MTTKASYAGEPFVGTDWLAAREAAFTAVRQAYETAREAARATQGSGPGWVSASTFHDESGAIVSASPDAVFIADPGAEPPVIDHDERHAPIYGPTPGRWLTFDEDTFAAHYRTQALAQPAGPAALQSLADLYDTDAATLLAQHPELWRIALDPEHTLNAGPAPAGRAMGDPGQLAVIDLYLADPQIHDLIEAYGGTAEPVEGELTREQVRIHGQARYEQMARLDNAMQTVRDLYLQALRQAYEPRKSSCLAAKAGFVNAGARLR